MVFLHAILFFIVLLLNVQKDIPQNDINVCRFFVILTIKENLTVIIIEKCYKYL